MALNWGSAIGCGIVGIGLWGLGVVVLEGLKAFSVCGLVVFGHGLVSSWVSLVFCNNYHIINDTALNRSHSIPTLNFNTDLRYRFNIFNNNIEVLIY